MINTIRWMKRSDIDEVQNIREICGVSTDLIKHLSSPSFILKVATTEEDEVSGYIRYKNCRDSVKIMELAVEPKFRRKGIAFDLISSLISKVDFSRKSIKIMVPEEMLPMQCLLKKLGFQAVGINNKRGTKYYFVKSQ